MPYSHHGAAGAAVTAMTMQPVCRSGAGHDNKISINGQVPGTASGGDPKDDGTVPSLGGVKSDCAVRLERLILNKKTTSASTPATLLRTPPQVRHFTEFPVGESPS
jgi:hypothetical protein